MFNNNQPKWSSCPLGPLNGKPDSPGSLPAFKNDPDDPKMKMIQQFNNHKMMNKKPFDFYYQHLCNFPIKVIKSHIVKRYFLTIKQGSHKTKSFLDYFAKKV